MSKFIHRRVAVIFGVALVACGGGLALALDEHITLEQVPEAARAALVKLAGGAKFSELEKETSNGVVVYEAEWKVNGVEHEAAVLADGTLIETEEEVAADQAPAAVRAAAAKAFGANAKVSYERKTFVYYEIEGKADGKGKEILVSPTGVIHGEELDDDKDDGPEENDDHE